ncbi:MAG: enoyl-CoA hydratase-related protein [bacterium]
MSLVRVVRDGPVLRVALSRPEARNALSAALVAELGQVFSEQAADASVRCVVLSGDGADFCAGADLADMQRLGSADFAENLADAERLSATFRALHDFPRPVVARVQGNVFGGGAGLVCACDIAVVAKDARFAFSEVRLGILPAIISPYVVRRIGEANARRLFLTGERFDGVRAAEIGLCAACVDAAELDLALERIVEEMLKGSPDAQRRIKALLDNVTDVPLAASTRRVPRFIAEARASEEGQEGLRAFLEKRRPKWASGD